MTAAYQHTRRRLHQRYGLHISPSQYARLCRDITLALPSLYFEYTEGVYIRLHFPFCGVLVRWVFDPIHQILVTALPLRWAAEAPKRRRDRERHRKRLRKPKYPQRWEDW